MMGFPVKAALTHLLSVKCAEIHLATGVANMTNPIEYTVKVHPNGDKHWYLNGKLHRADGPASEWSSGSKFWYLNGKLHREDGPAIEWINGSKEWCLNGKLHREDGPAIEWDSGNKKYWYLNGEKLTEEEFDAKMNPAKELTVAELEELLGYKIKVVKS